MANLETRSDPIKNKFYDPIDQAEKLSNKFFWISIILSFFVLFIEKNSYPKSYNCIQTLFCLTVILILITGLMIRIYLKPRADDMRLKDFMSHAYKIPLLHVQTELYYNNNETIPRRRLAAQLLENSLHSKSTINEMVKTTRYMNLFFISVWLILILNRETEMDTIAVATMALFGEQIISNYFRMEWTQIRYERVYDDVYNLFQSNPNDDVFEVKALEALSKYETTKANGSIKLSNDIFDSNNKKITLEWETIKEKLHIL